MKKQCLINSTQPPATPLVDVPFLTAYYEAQREPLRDLKTRHGPCFITGNHEYHGDING